MSIINDALKQAQENLLKKKQAEEESSSPNTESHPPEQSTPPPTPTPEPTPAPMPTPTPSSPTPQPPESIHPTPPIKTEEPSLKKLNDQATKKPKRNTARIVLFVGGFLLVIALLLMLTRSNLFTDNLKLVNLKNVVEKRPAPKATVINGASYRLSGIMDVGDKNPVALINGNVYKEGESLDGFLVMEITLEKVVLSKNGEKIELKVKN